MRRELSGCSRTWWDSWRASGCRNLRWRRRRTEPARSRRYENSTHRLRRQLEAKQAAGVAFVDFAAVGFGNIQDVEAADGFADIAGALFGIERRVGGKKNLIRAKEIESAANRSTRAEGGRIRVKHLEIVLRTFLQATQIDREVFLFGARAQLVEAVAGAS